MNQTKPRKGLKPGTKLVLLVIPAAIIAAGWMLWQELQQSPIRQAGVPLSAYGVVAIELTPDPFPPRTTEPVQMTLRLSTAGSRMAIVDRISYRYGPVDGTDAFQGEAQEVSMETYQGFLQMTSPGDWWIEVNLTHQGETGNARFTLPVQKE